MSKILITSGCSFSENVYQTYENYKTWPGILFKLLEKYGFTEFKNSAMGSQGNGLISRGVIYNVCKALETYQPENILVGVMWSGSNRLDYRCSNTKLLDWYGTNIDGWIENPTGFVENTSKNWVIMNQHWQNKEAQTYYKYFYDFTGASILSIEHILRLQYFLKDKKISYFFTNYADNNIVDKTSEDYERNRNEIDYLYNLIDFSNYLPTTSENRWLRQNSINKEDYEQRHFYNGHLTAWIHPNSNEHTEFVERLILPYLLEKELVR